MYTIPGWYAALLALSAGVAGVLLASLFRYRSRRAALWLCWFLFGLVLWTLSQLLILLRRAYGPPQPALFERLGLMPLDLIGPFTTSAVALVALLLFVLEYTGHEHLVTRRTILLLSVVPALVFVAALTNGSHHLFYTSIERVDDLDGWAFALGPVNHLNRLYLWGLTLSSLGLLGWWSVRAHSTYRGQTAAIVAGVLAPFFLNAAWFLGLIAVDLTEVGFVATGCCLWVAMVRYDLGNLVPVARATVLEQIEVGVMVVDDSDQVVDANEAAQWLLAPPDGSLVGTDLPTVLDRLDIGDIRSDGGDRTVETTVETDGGERFLTVGATRLSDRRGRPVGSVFLLQDVTERREREKELARKNEQLDQFASLVSHDLRNPLSIATARVNAAREADDGAEHLGQARDALRRMDDLVGDMLALARTGQPIDELERVRLGEAARGAWRMTDTSDGTLVVEDDFEFLADPGRLQQLFENLFRNAIEHGPGDGTVRVGRCGDAGCYVADEGPGIPPDERESVFESGYSTDPDGTGFGLAIVEQVAEAHGWDIAVTDSEAGGARFEITGLEEG